MYFYDDMIELIIH